jgi:hypothetical protein
MAAIYVRYRVRRRNAERVMFSLDDELFAWVLEEFPDETVDLQVATTHEGEDYEAALGRLRVQVETSFVELGIPFEVLASGFSTGLLSRAADADG